MPSSNASTRRSGQPDTSIVPDMGILRRRHRDRGLHGHKHVDHQRLTAILMIASGLLRVAIWAILLALYLLHVKFARDLYASVSFVAMLSVLALLLTDWGQVAASLAQLTAGDAHHDAEATRREVGVDFTDLEGDIARLAELQPGPEAVALAARIRARLKGS